MKSKAEVVVVGGGVMGASIAFHLGKRGIRDILLVERNTLASGTTGKSSAVIRQHYSNHVTAKMALESLRVFQNFKTEVGGTAAFRNTGWIFVVNSDEDVKALRANLDLQRSVGIDTRFLDSNQLNELEPRMFTADLKAGCYEPAAGVADPTVTTNSFADAAIKLGVEVITQTKVTRVVTSGGKVKTVVTTAGEVQTTKIVNATNVWANRIAASVGLKLPLEARRDVICLFGHPQKFGKTLPVVVDNIYKTYLRPEEGQTWIGSVDPNLELVPNPDKFNEGVTLDTMVEFGEKFARRFPAMEDGELRRGYAALYDVTPDWHPILDEAPGVEGFYIAVGFSGHGFKLSPSIGKMIAQFVDTGKAEDIDFFRLSRFAENKPIVASYGYSWMG